MARDVVDVEWVLSLAFQQGLYRVPEAVECVLGTESKRRLVVGEPTRKTTPGIVDLGHRDAREQALVARGSHGLRVLDEA